MIIFFINFMFLCSLSATDHVPKGECEILVKIVPLLCVLDITLFTLLEKVIYYPTA